MTLVLKADGSFHSLSPHKIRGKSCSSKIFCSLTWSLLTQSKDGGDLTFVTSDHLISFQTPFYRRVQSEKSNVNAAIYTEPENSSLGPFPLVVPQNNNSDYILIQAVTGCSGQQP